MADKLLGRIGDFLQHRTAWYKLPGLLSVPRRVEIRNQLRRENLYDTEEPAFQKKPVPANLDPALRNERTVDGTYNDFAFPEMADDADLREVYGNDVNKVDLMTGLYAEPLPPGFGFSETAFLIFVLMASRRLKSDRFFTDDYRAEVYTATGLKFIDETTMLTVLTRHYPELAPALEGLDNAFKPWKATTPA